MFNFLHNFSPSPVLISFGPLNVYWYGLFIIMAVLAAFSLALNLAPKIGLLKSKVFDLVFWAVILGIIGARIYHVLLEFDYYSANLWNIFKFWEGGLAIHGGIIAGIIVVFVFAKKEKLSFWQFGTVAAPAAALAQAIGRWGNYFNQELFGYPTDLPWGIPIDLMKRPYEYINYDYFHPAFLYESLGNLLIFLILLAIIFKISLPKKNWRLAPLLYLVFYSVLRFILEFFRLDETPLILGWRAPQAVSVIIIIVAGAFLFLPLIRKKKPDNV